MYRKNAKSGFGHFVKSSFVQSAKKHALEEKETQNA